MTRLLLSLLLVLAGCGIGSDAQPTPTTWPMFDTAAERALWDEGCGEDCGTPDEVTNGLECWNEGKITYCRPQEAAP